MKINFILLITLDKLMSITYVRLFVVTISWKVKKVVLTIECTSWYLLGVNILSRHRYIFKFKFLSSRLDGWVDVYTRGCLELFIMVYRPHVRCFLYSVASTQEVNANGVIVVKPKTLRVLAYGLWIVVNNKYILRKLIPKLNT